MKKNFLLLFLMCLLGGVSSSLWAQTVHIGSDGTSKLEKAPFNLYAINSVCQQIYTVAEFTNYAENNTIPSGNISKLTFYENTGQNLTCTNIKVYMKHTDKEAFSSSSDWVKDFTESDLVFDSNGATLSIVDGVLELPLTTPFVWNRTQSILVYVDVNSKSSATARSYFKAFSTQSKKTLYYSGNSTSGLDVNNWRSGNSPTTSKAQMGFTFSADSEDPAETPAPTAPTLNYPLNNQENVFNPFLRFTLGSNTTHYQILMGTGTGEMTALTDWVEKTISEVDFQTSGLQPNTTYTWKVVAKNDKNDDPKTTESDTWSFTTKQISAPGQIEDAYPNGEQGLVNPEFTWTFGSDTEEYQVIIDGEAKTEWTNPGSSTTGSYQTSGLSAGEHTWRIDAKNSVATTTGTEYSFSIASIPDNITPISPVDGATGVTSNIVTFKFAPNTTHYKLVMSDTDENGMFYFSQANGGTGNNWTETNGVEEMSFTIPYFGLGKTLYWAVDVKNAIGERSVFSINDEEKAAIYSFTAASTLPVANVAPENGTNNLENPVLSWNFKGNATHYMVYLGTEENNLTAQTEWLARGTEGTGLVGSGSYQTTDLAAATQYFWRVDVKEGENSETVLAGDVWSFVTTLEAPVAQANPAQVVPSLGDYGSTTINWNKIETVQGYNVYLGEEKLNAELLPTDTTNYEIPANSLKLNYNMDPGYDFFVEAYYGDELGSVKSDAVNVKVTGTGYFKATIYKNDYYNRLEGATITLSCTGDEFGNVYEEGVGEQYEYTTNSLGQAYYEITNPDNSVEQVTSIRIQNGTYNVTVSKDNYESYEGTITINKGETTTLSQILTADPTVIFDVTLFNETFNTIDVYLENENWEDAQPGNYHVYLKNGDDIDDLGTQFFAAPDDMTTSVYFKYLNWGGLGKGNYQFGVSKIDEEINWSSVKTISHDVFEGGEDESWNNEANWRDNEIPASTANVYIFNALTIAKDEEITVETINIQSEGSLTINGSLTADNVYNNTQAGNLCINDGGQLRQSNESLNGKFVMNIVKGDWSAENDTTGWQFISSPIPNAPISQFIPANQAQGDYDLYRYDGGTWYNHKAGGFNDETFVSGRAYLASLEIAETVTLSGKLNAEKTFARQYSYTEEVENTDKFKNFFLVGNPFTFDMDLKYMTFSNVVEGIAVVKPTGGYEYRTVSNNGIVPVGDGFFIKTTGAYPSISYDENAAAKRSEKVESINIIASSNAGEDNVIINFNGKKEGFNKLQNFNEGIANIFVAKENERYGIFNCNRDVNEVTLSFIPKQMGSYSISFDIDGEFESVVLVDRLTGIETDMLAEKEYNFIATKDDRSDRFVLKLANGEEPSENSQFVYQSGEELIINAEGTIQIIDMMGRMIYSSNAENSRINVSNLKGATYIVRNITDNDVKVQKVVIY
ncbi:MAG: PEGA domain-containing protein [Bacteroidales bacterium]|nr:PEGA domain-containing protein [Bacteroidales bacterium]